MGGAEPPPDDGDYSKMSFFGLFFMGFFWVCGGPYGGEGLVQLAPTGVIFSVYLASQLLYAAPIGAIFQPFPPIIHTFPLILTHFLLHT